jgi:excisionase family DNA binding protein
MVHTQGLLSAKEVASYLGVSPCAVRRLAKSRDIPFFRRRGVGIRFRKEEVDEWLAEGASKPSPLLASALNVDLQLENYDKLFLKGGVKVSPKGKTWNYPFGSVYLRLTKSGKERWYIYYRNEGRRIRQAVKGAQSRADALKVLQVEVADAFRMKHGFKRDERKIRFDEFSKLYIENYAKVNKRSWKDDVYSLGVLKSLFGMQFLTEIDTLDIEKLKTQRLKEGISKARINRNLALLKKMFNLAIDWDYANDNPVRRVRLFSEKDNLKERILTEDEEIRLLEASAPHLKSIIVTALHTGMRRGEILGLRWHQLDLPKRIIRVEKTKNGKIRFVPLNEVLFRELAELKKQNGTSLFVFLYPRTKKPVKDVKTAFRAATRRAGIRGLRFHDLRHTFASRLLAMGYDLITVRDLLGHESTATTQRYTHSFAEQKREAVQALCQKGLKNAEFVPTVSTQPAEVLPANALSTN